jgi:hypothetical protein
MSGVRARLLVALAVLVLVLGINPPSFSTPPATAQAGLFSDAARQPAADAGVTIDRTIVRTRYVDVNVALLDGTPKSVGTPLGRGDVLTLNLFGHQSAAFPDVTVTAVRDRVVASSTGRGYVWSGHVQGSNPSVSPVTIAVEDGVMIANVRAYNANYQVRYTPGGVQVINQIDERQLPPDNHLTMPVSTARQLALGRQVPRAAAPGATSDTGNTMDMLVAYTTQARVEAGGTAAIVAQINTAVGEANTAFRNSLIPEGMRLVGTMETNYTSAGLASGLIPDLQRVTGLNAMNQPDPGAPMADVRAMRDTVRADLVSLWVDGELQPGTTGTVGIAWVMTNGFINNMQAFAGQAFSVVARAYATGAGNYTFAHEIGHNLGANHDHITDANLPFTPLYPFAFDYIAPGNAFRTVMAYQSSCPGPCPLLLNFSNPNVTFNGQPTGVAGNGPNAADNHQTLINTLNAVINFRQCNQPTCNTVTNLTPTPGAATATPTASCSPRPAVTVTTTNAGGGNLQVTVTAGGSVATGPRLQQLQFGAATNALITVPLANLSNVTGNQNANLPIETRSVTFTVRHGTAGQATTVPLTVVDGCGSWPTLVGGGATAF